MKLHFCNDGDDLWPYGIRPWEIRNSGWICAVIYGSELQFNGHEYLRKCLREGREVME